MHESLKYFLFMLYLIEYIFKTAAIVKMSNDIRNERGGII